MKRWIGGSILAAILVLAGCETQEQNRQAAQGRWELARSKINCQLAQQAFDAGNMAECKKQLSRVMSREAQYAPVYLLAAKVAMREGALDDAQNYLAMALKIEPNSAEAWYGKALVEEQTGSLEAAVESAAKAAQCEANDPEYVMLLAQLRVRAGQPEQALKTLQAVEAQFRGHAALQSVLADLYLMNGDATRAVDCLERLVRAKPDDSEAQERLALALVRDGRAAEAAPLAESLLKKGQGEPAALRCALADGHAQAGNYVKAAVDYVILCHGQPGNAEWQCRLAECYVAMHDDRAAQERVALALKADPHHARARTLAGYLCYVRGDLKGAEGHLKQALERADQPKLATVLLVSTLRAEGRTKEADEVLAEFGSRGEPSPPAAVPERAAAGGPWSWDVKGQPTRETASDRFQTK